MDSDLEFYAEVRVVESPERPELIGLTGAILGMSDSTHGDRDPTYAVILDGHERVITFYRFQLCPTGARRRRDDYY